MNGPYKLSLRCLKSDAKSNLTASYSVKGEDGEFSRTIVASKSLNLASDFRHLRDNLNGPFTNDDFNEALWEIDEILRRQPPCTR